MAAIELEISVPDMKCQGCADRIARVAQRLEGARSAEVSLEDKKAKVTVTSEEEAKEVVRAIERAGYSPEVI